MSKPLECEKREDVFNRIGAENTNDGRRGRIRWDRRKNALVVETGEVGEVVERLGESAGCLDDSRRLTVSIIVDNVASGGAKGDEGSMRNP